MGCISSRHNSQNTIENTSRAECVVCFNEANTVCLRDLKKNSSTPLINLLSNLLPISDKNGLRYL